MAVITGYGGSATFGTAIAVLKRWTLDDQVDMQDTTGMASGASGRKSFTPTLSEWSVQAEGEIDSADAKFAGSPPSLSPRQSATLSLSAGGSLAYAGTAIVKSVKITSPVEGVIEFDITFQGTGVLTYPS